MAGFINLDKIHEEVKRYFIPFCEELISIHGKNLQSVSIYGSAASGEFIPSKSDINSLLIFDVYDFGILRKSLRVVEGGRKRKITAPLFLTKNIIQKSTDVFPIEFLEIRENNICVYGEDLFRDVVISDRHLRLQCEQQLKGKILLLRSAYLETGGKSSNLEALMVDSISAVFPAFRTALRLKGIVPPVSKDDVISYVSREFGIDASLFMAILRDKKGDSKIGRMECDAAFERYIEELQKLADCIDVL